MNGKYPYRLRSFGRVDMCDEVDGATFNGALNSQSQMNPTAEEQKSPGSEIPQMSCRGDSPDARASSLPNLNTKETVTSVAGEKCLGASDSGSGDYLDARSGSLFELLSFSKNKSKPVAEEIPFLSQSPECLNYFMQHERRGRCVIINNRCFDMPNLHERKGTEVDGRKLVSCFENLHFDVQLIEDRKVKEIRSTINDIASQDFSNDDCFVCCVLTHGELNSLWARDERYVLDLLLQPFRGDNCKSLAGKPKIFFIQACQGDKLDKGMTVGFNDVEDSKDAAFFRIPSWADFLIAFSTVPGYFSWRNTTNGSWFIQALVATITEHYKDHDLLSMLTITAQRVAYQFESFVPGDAEFDKRKQIPCIKSMLTRRIYFPPKNNLSVSKMQTMDTFTKLQYLIKVKHDEYISILNDRHEKERQSQKVKHELELLQQQLQSLMMQKQMHQLRLNGKSGHLPSSSSSIASSVSSSSVMVASSSGVKIATVSSKVDKKSSSASSSAPSSSLVSETIKKTSSANV